MNIALIGYGKMGKEIEKIALERGHTISIIIDNNNLDDFNHPDFINSDVAIEFTVPEVAYDNYQKCFQHHIPVVSGTTGWLSQYDAICRQCIKEEQTFFYASNFSIGMNLFFELNEVLSSLMSNQLHYSAFMKEWHHIHKKDAPSGTAITLLEGLLQHSQKYDNWYLKGTEATDNAISVEAIREGEIPGTHSICYESEVDKIEITHQAKSRAGFAMGAVLAAEFTQDNKGILGMKDLLKIKKA